MKKTSYWKIGEGVGGTVIFSFILLIAVFIILQVFQLFEEIRVHTVLAMRGEIVKAQISDKHFEFGVRGGSDHFVKAYYETKDGRVLGQEFLVKEAFYENSSSTEVFDVKYDPQDPLTARPAAVGALSSMMRTNIIISGILLAVVVVGGIDRFYNKREARRKRRQSAK